MVDNDEPVILVEKEIFDEYTKTISLNKEYEVKINQLTEEKEKLKSNSEARIKEHEKILSEKDKKISTLQSQIADFNSQNSQNSQLQKKNQELEKEIQLLKQQILTETNNKQQIQKERDNYLDINKQMINNVEKERDQDKKKIAELESKVRELDYLSEKKRAESERKIELLNADLANLKNIKQNPTSNNEKELKTEMERIRQESKIEEMSKEIETLRIHMSTLRDQCMKKENELQLLRKNANSSRIGMNEEIVREALTEMKKVLINQKNTLESRILVIKDQKVDSNNEWFKALYLGDLEDAKKSIEILTFHQESIVDF